MQFLHQKIKSFADGPALLKGAANFGQMRGEARKFLIDIDEELSRLSAHLAEVRRTLEKGGRAGKRLDFLMQELHREANTLGAKSADAEVAQCAMEIKLLIEQMREQVQNIE